MATEVTAIPPEGIVQTEGVDDPKNTGNPELAVALRFST
jgi:hypothetical protein